MPTQLGNLSIKRFYPSEHEDFMRDLLGSRGMSWSLIPELPQFGLIAFIEGEPVAAGFLRQVEGGFAMLDGLISNPNKSSEERHEAIDGVVHGLTAMAQRTGLTKLIAFSEDEGTLKRSLEHGFVHMKHSFIVLNLQG